MEDLEIITPLSNELISKIDELQIAIHTVHPQMPVLLQKIHKLLKDNPAIVTILNENQIEIIVSGLKLKTKTELITASLKKTTTKPLKSVTVDDL